MKEVRGDRNGRQLWVLRNCRKETVDKRQKVCMMKWIDYGYLGVTNITFPNKEIWLSSLSANINKKSKDYHCGYPCVAHVCACVDACTHPFPAYWLHKTSPEKALCKWMQLLAGLVHVLWDPFRSSGPGHVITSSDRETFAKIPKPWFLVPSVLGVSNRFRLLSICPLFFWL